MSRRPWNKVCSLTEAIAAIEDGSSIALGGNTLHRSPSAAVHEIIRQRKKDLTIVKTAGSYDIDVLCGTGCVSRLIVAYVGFENLQGMAPQFRSAIEQGRVELEEHTCTSVITGLRAAAQGIPFMPIAGMSGTDLAPGRFLSVVNPYAGGEVVTIPAIVPDWAIVHVQEADEQGNARIAGTEFEDILMCKAATKVMLTCERLADGSSFAADRDRTSISGFRVQSVVEAPNGAWPASCAGNYDIDEAYIDAYYRAATGASPDALRLFLASHAVSPAARQPVEAASSAL